MKKLWFIIFLFMLSMAALPLFSHLRRDRGQRHLAKLATFCARRGNIFLLGIPLLLAAETSRGGL